MPEDARRAALLAALADGFAEDAREVDAAICAELQAEARRFSRHLDVEWVPEGGLVPDTESRGWPEPDPAEAAAERAGIAIDHAIAPGTPAAALIGPGTYSSGEALAYHFQAQRLGPLVGERTPGAADHVTPIVLDAHVRANLPRGYVRDAVTGANWEQTGVRPDVPCAEAEALERAL